MTGFGTATAATPGGRLSVELRSVNHRFSEVQLRVPRELAPLEDRVRGIVQARVYRGRVEVVVTREDGSRRPRTIRADLDLAATYARALRDVAGAVGASGRSVRTLHNLTRGPNSGVMRAPKRPSWPRPASTANGTLNAVSLPQAMAA